MTLHLAEIAAALAPGAHAVLLLDQAGWHMSAGLVIPDNITLLPVVALGLWLARRQRSATPKV